MSMLQRVRAVVPQLTQTLHKGQAGKVNQEKVVMEFQLVERPGLK